MVAREGGPLLLVAVLWSSSWPAVEARRTGVPIWRPLLRPAFLLAPSREPLWSGGRACPGRCPSVLAGAALGVCTGIPVNTQDFDREKNTYTYWPSTQPYSTRAELPATRLSPLARPTLLNPLLSPRSSGSDPCRQLPSHRPPRAAAHRWARRRPSLAMRPDRRSDASSAASPDVGFRFRAADLSGKGLAAGQNGGKSTSSGPKRRSGRPICPARAWQSAAVCQGELHCRCAKEVVYLQINAQESRGVFLSEISDQPLPFLAEGRP